MKGSAGGLINADTKLGNRTGSPVSMIAATVVNPRPDQTRPGHT